MNLSRRGLLLAAFTLLMAACQPSFAASTSTAPAAKVEAFPQARQLMLSPSMKASFPRLGMQFVILAPPTGTGPEDQKEGNYNCIAWSIGETKRWVWPGKSVKSFDQMYAQKGYQRLKVRDYSKVTGHEKVVLYGRLTESGQMEVTHAARQMPNGTYTSKLGAGCLIVHATPEALTGPSYGEPIAVYLRPTTR